MSVPPKQRVIAYVDGFNLYFGLCDAGYRRYLWLNVHALAQRLVRADQDLVATKYFTARISGARPGDNPAYANQRNDKRKRQTDYLDVLGTIANVSIYYGQYLEKPRACRNCGATWNDAEEKMTDVNIATEMLVDAFANRFDTAILVSADSDLAPPIKAVRDWFPHKRINVAFPPKRHSERLKAKAHGQCVIQKGALRKSQLPDEVTLPNGYLLSRPATWC